MKLTDLILVALLVTLLTGCANIKDKTIAHEITNSARDAVEENLNVARSYINDDKEHPQASSEEFKVKLANDCSNQTMNAESRRTHFFCKI